jgi:hypothetical protein
MSTAFDPKVCGHERTLAPGGDLSGTRFVCRSFGTAAATAAGVYGTGGIGALVGGTFILVEHAYDLWMKNIQPRINQGFSDLNNGLRSGWIPFRY